MFCFYKSAKTCWQKIGRVTLVAFEFNTIVLHLFMSFKGK